MDEYVGSMKGVILSINPHATIIDISHHIDPHDIIGAAYVIDSVYQYFPTGAVHVVVVDPGVGSRRSILAVKKMGYTFLAPDNGVLTLILKSGIEAGTIDAIVRVDNSRYFLETVSQTFHGRDIFAPVAAHISNGVSLSSLGESVNPNAPIRLDIPKPYISDKGELVGAVVSIDRFGNLITNIDYDSLNKLLKTASTKHVVIRMAKHTITGLSPSYASAGPHQPLVLFGSRGYLELAVNCGSAKDYFMADRGDAVIVICTTIQGKRKEV